MDAQARLGSVAGLAALVHGLALAAARRPRGSALARAGDRRELVPRGSRRARGDAALGRRDAPAARARRRGDRPRGRGALRERGGGGALEEAERILREGNGADRMRAAHAAGGMRAVLEGLVAEAAQAA